MRKIKLILNNYSKNNTDLYGPEKGHINFLRKKKFGHSAGKMS